jgi:hypothetical protein
LGQVLGLHARGEGIGPTKILVWVAFEQLLIAGDRLG